MVVLDGLLAVMLVRLCLWEYNTGVWGELLSVDFVVGRFGCTA